MRENLKHQESINRKTKTVKTQGLVDSCLRRNDWKEVDPSYAFAGMTVSEFH